jgi:DNA-binding NtrC family response regulator
MRIVIAEKDQTGRRLLAQLLRMEGHDVVLIEEGGDARSFIKQHRPEMVLMNMFNTFRSEAPLLRKSDMREEEGFSPVVVMTSMRACEKIYSFMGRGESNEVNAFDRLSASAKIGTMDYVQRVCEVLARSLGSSSRKRDERFALRSAGQGVLDLSI